MALKFVDDVDKGVFHDEISYAEIVYLAKQLRNF